MKPGSRNKTGQAKPASALAVLTGIRRAHKRMGRETAPLVMAAQLSHGMTRDFLAQYGPEALSIKRKEPYTNDAMIRAMLAITAPVRVNSSCSIDWSSLLGISLRALVATLAQTGFRGDEVSLTTGRSFDRRCMTRWNVRWRIAGEWVFAPTAAQLLGLTSADYAVIIPPPSKADLSSALHGIVTRSTCASATQQPSMRRELSETWSSRGQWRLQTGRTPRCL